MMFYCLLHKQRTPGKGSIQISCELLNKLFLEIIIWSEKNNYKWFVWSNFVIELWIQVVISYTV